MRPSRRHPGASHALALWLTSIGCVGGIGDGGELGTPGPAAGGVGREVGPGAPAASGPTQPGPASASGPCGPGPATVGPWLLRRLNRREYESTIRDLLGTSAADLLPADGGASGFDTDANALVPSSALVEGTMVAAEKLAA